VSDALPNNVFRSLTSLRCANSIGSAILPTKVFISFMPNCDASNTADV